ncbi:hypothetical protein [Pyrococcus kukulkanii]
MENVRLLERKLEITRELKIRFAKEEIRLLRLIKQAKVRNNGRAGAKRRH